LGWHQSELAERAGIGLATIQHLERGVLMAHVSTLVKLVNCFEASGIVSRNDEEGGIGVRRSRNHDLGC
jgi:transcriptional regulator with XRE-family HTH domain